MEEYLGCVVDEHVECRKMVEERGKSGARALSDWLRRCKAIVGEVRGATFKRLMEMLVDTVLLYGAEVWGCRRQLGPVDNVQMKAAQIFLGMGRLHPLVSLQFEMNVLPMRWEAMRRGIEFWVHEMRLEEGRILKLVMLEALELGKGVRCMGEGSAVEFGDVWMEWFEGAGPEWTVNEGSKAPGEGYCMEEGKRGLEGRS